MPAANPASRSRRASCRHGSARAVVGAGAAVGARPRRCRLACDDRLAGRRRPRASATATTCVFKGTAWSWLPFAVGIPLLPVFGWLGTTARRCPASFASCSRCAVLAGTALAIANARADVERDAGPGSIRSRSGWGRAGVGGPRRSARDRRRPGDRDAGGRRPRRRSPSWAPSVPAWSSGSASSSVAPRTASTRASLGARGGRRRPVWRRPGWPGTTLASVARVVAPDHGDGVLEPELRDRQVLGEVGAVRGPDRAARPRRCAGPRRGPRRHRPGSAWR